jgi:phosphotriesterase-related protein
MSPTPPTRAVTAAPTTGPTDRSGPSGIVRTVLGDVPAADLGRTLIHEHLASDLTTYWVPDFAPAIAGATVSLATLSEVRVHAFSVRDNLVLGDLDLAAAELAGFRAAGGATVVDVTSHGIGRDVRASRLIAERSGVNVIVGCGYYVGSSHPVGLGRRTEADLADEMTRELVDGIGSTGIRAGVLGELGVGSSPMEPAERRVLRAAALAQRATGAGMIVHSAPGSESVFEILRVLDRAGAQLDKVVISHLDERFRDDLRLFRRAATSGVRFGFDTFGREIYYDGRRKQHPSDTQRIEMVCRLLDAGLGDRVALAQDICLKHELAAFGGQGYAHVLANIVPRMLHAGIPQDAVDRMLVGTPAQILALPG